MINNINSQKTKDRWNEIIKIFREACYLSHYNEKKNATEILEKKLPKMINDWQKNCGLEKEKYQEKINRSFSLEQLRVANAFLLREALKEENFQKDSNNKLSAEEDMIENEIERIIDKENFYYTHQSIQK